MCRWPISAPSRRPDPNDTLTGNAGSDLFTFVAGGDQDYAGVGSDILEWLQIFQYGHDTVISFSNNQTVVLIDVKARTVDEKDFVVADDNLVASICKGILIKDVQRTI